MNIDQIFQELNIQGELVSVDLGMVVFNQGQSGGGTRTVSRTPPPPTPAVITAGDANKIINSPTPKEVEDLSKMAVFGVIPVGYTIRAQQV